MSEQTLKLAWLSGQSLRAYIAARRAENDKPLTQIGRKTITISRMTPAPPRIRGDYVSPPSSSKRERSPAPRFIDLREVQGRVPSRRRFAGRKEAQEAEELIRRTGQGPQKKTMGGRAFQVRMAAATQMRQRKQSSARKFPAMSTTIILSDDEVLSFSSDEIDELDPSSSDEEPPSLGRARKMPSRSSPSLRSPVQDSSSEEEMNLENPSNVDERVTTPTVDPEPMIQLFRVFQLHTLPTDIFQETKQLPFLTRNLRKSFHSLCHNLSIPVASLPHDQQGTVLVRYDHVANASFERPVPKWFCPLCNLLGRLATREMLSIHLKTYHREMYIEWLQPTENERDQGISWRLHILIPEIDERMIGHAFSRPVTVPKPTEPEELPKRTEHTSPRTPRKRLTTTPLTQGDTSTSPLMISPKTSPRFEKSKEPTTPRQFTPRPPQYPRPPPSSNRLGAAARLPYLPAKSTFGGPDMYYSTRFSGPCLFDLLGLLPLEHFGVFEGTMIDQEEEIYSDDELGQEEKVIIALWARWIMLNKVEFNKDRAGGVKKFIDEYWKMIHLAAGWEALVYQLLVLAAWRLLRHYEIIPLLEHYEELVGMQYWDEWDSSEE